MPLRNPLNPAILSTNNTNDYAASRTDKNGNSHTLEILHSAIC